MLEDKMLNLDDLDKIVGGISGENGEGMPLETNQVKKYEYKCNSCGQTSYQKVSLGIFPCPHCGKFSEYTPTGSFIVETINS